MKLCPKTERRRFYGLFHGFESFSEAEASIRIFLDNQHLPQPLQHALTTSIAIDLIRPFKQDGKQMRLDRALIPAEHLEIFKHFENLRDKAFAHVDSTVFTDDGGRNRVLVKSHANGFAPIMNRATLNKEQIRMVIPLLNWLLDYSSSEFTKIVNKFLCDGPIKGTIFEVNIDSDDDLPLYVPHVDRKPTTPHYHERLDTPRHCVDSLLAGRLRRCAASRDVSAASVSRVCGE